MTKVCTKCGRDLPPEAYYTQVNHKDRLSSRCKECVRADTKANKAKRDPEQEANRLRQWAKDNHERKLEMQKKYRQTHVDKLRRYGREKAKCRRRDNPGVCAESVAAYRSRHPEAVAAVNAVHHAKRRGELVAPDVCERCGADELAIHAHHEDYSKPLEVIWLCASCHKLHHLKKGTAS